MGIMHLLNIPINFEQMTLFHYWIALTFVKNFGVWNQFVSWEILIFLIL
jgi:hypothetical protein